MIALDIAHLDPLDTGADNTVGHRQAVRRVVVLLMAAPLAHQHQREGRVAADVNPGDMVHLEGDLQATCWLPENLPPPEYHAAPSASNAPMIWRGSRHGTATITSRRSSRSAACGCFASHKAAARPTRLRPVGVAASAASASVGRAFTSTKATPSRAQRSGRFRRPASCTAAPAAGSPWPQIEKRDRLSSAAPPLGRAAGVTCHVRPLTPARADRARAAAGR